ncbi:MAG: hypothetical protein EA408_00855 [Marinilabiliales bacterium]|nr:MAG: hypothetical protein EA408_00855 [Marinilabiliales bacterium]
MNTVAKYLVFFVIATSLYSCNSQRPVHYSKTHSYGFQHDDHVYFLLDYQVWKRGGRFWFIMPVQLPSKIYLKQVYLYRYEPDLNDLEKLAVLRDEAMRSINVRYTKFTEDDNKIVFAYHAGYDEEINPLIDLFIWDTQTGKPDDTGFENPVRDNHPLYQEYFSDYQSPWRDNPAIISISALKNEILQHLTNEDYDLPEEW